MAIFLATHDSLGLLKNSGWQNFGFTIEIQFLKFCTRASKLTQALQFLISLDKLLRINVSCQVNVIEYHPVGLKFVTGEPRKVKNLDLVSGALVFTGFLIRPLNKEAYTDWYKCLFRWESHGCLPGRFAKELSVRITW